jgi:uncharacterized protein YeeX (DUF496 family)
MQLTFKNHDKELVTMKGQLNKVQHENHNLSNKLKEVEHVIRKIENLQQEYVELNQLNWKTCNSLKCFQTDFERMTWDYNWRTPNSLQDSNVSPSERQRKSEELGHVP